MHELTIGLKYYFLNHGSKILGGQEIRSLINFRFIYILYKVDFNLYKNKFSIHFNVLIA